MSVTTTVERERKLRIDDTFELPDLDGELLPPEVFTSTYFDTSDLRLARWGVTLRRRQRDERAVWQLKLPRDDARLEVELPDDAGRPPGDLRDLLVALVRGAALDPVIALRTHRVGRRVEEADGVVDVVVDTVSIVDGGPVRGRFREVEVELVAGDARALDRLERTLRRAGAHETKRPKLFRALGLGPAADAELRAEHGPAVERLQRALRDQLAEIVLHDPGTRLGRDPEELHRMRVAVRRLRAMLRAARPLLDRAWVTALRDELEWLGDGLGAVRDLDVLLAYLVEAAATLTPAERAAFAPLLDRLRGERGRAQERALAQLRDPRYLTLLDRLDAAARAPAVVDDDGSLVAIARRATRRLGKTVDGLDEEPGDEALHEVRIAAKRARYAAELAAEDAGKRAERFIRAAKKLQDLLGEHQDAVVAEQRLRALAPVARDADGGIALGRLLERQTERRRTARAGFARVWRKLRRRGRAAWERGR